MNVLRRWGWLLLLGPVVIGLARLRFDADVLNLLPGELPVVQGLKLHQRYFAQDAELIVTIAADDPDSAAHAAQLAAECLRADPDLVASATWRPPWLEHPEDTAEFIAWLWLNQPPEAMRRLEAGLAATPLRERLRATREALATSMSPAEIGRLGYDPLGLTDLPASGAAASPGQGEEQFTSADGTFRLVFVEPGPASSGFATAHTWLTRVRARLDECVRRDGWPAEARVALTGKPAFVAEAATGMRADIRSSVAGTLAVILILFWLAHRRWRPLLWLGFFLQVILLGTAALGGLLVGTLNLVSFGFAAILLGLAVDYGLVLYQEARAHGDLPAAAVRERVGGGIRGSAVTTATAFALLLLSGLPGLGQLGLLVALGVLLGAIVMLYGFLPLARGEHGTTGRHGGDGQRSPAAQSPVRFWHARLANPVATLLLVVGGLVLWQRFPSVDHSTQPLSPRHSPADAAMKELEHHFARKGGSVFTLVSGQDEAEVRERLSRLEDAFRVAGSHGTVGGHELPLALWPVPGWQRVNLAVASALADRTEDFRGALREAGFSSEAMALAEGVFRAWQAFAQAVGPVWPSSDSARWLLARVVARTPDGWLALGAVHGAGTEAVAQAARDVAGVTFFGWQLLGESLLQYMETRVTWLFAMMLVALVVCLRWTFGNWTEPGLSLAALAFGLFLLLLVMATASWSWNLMNLTALPLLLGAGVDYAIHVQLALRRHAGDLSAVLGTTGRALLLCSGTTVAAFGSLAWSSNAGLASLGAVCAAGVACMATTAVGFLPAWHYAARRHDAVMD
ncbi:MAG: MMPL family transporter [Verrucomicrobia bacterium]|nr:MMPL family transporter [Verrucomicrobiota bacterium]